MIQESLRHQDHDAYLAGLLMPRTSRDAYFTIRALNVEWATIKESVNGNTTAGKFRFQWWRQEIDQLYQSRDATLSSSSSSSHPLLPALKRAIHSHRLTHRWFERLLDAREADMDNPLIETMDQLELYTEHTHASMLYLTLECLGVREETADQCASHCGIFSGLVTLLRGTPYHLSHSQQVYLPQELLQKYNLDQTLSSYMMQPQDRLTVSSSDPSSYPLNNTPEDTMDHSHHITRVSELVSEVVHHAQAHLSRARVVAREMPHHAQPIFLSTVAPELFLTRLQQAQMDLLSPSLYQPTSPLRLQLHMLKSKYWSV